VVDAESTVGAVSIEIRSISPDEALAYRRAVRAGFHNTDTVDDAEWAADVVDPVERAMAAFDGGSTVATLQSFPTELTVPGGHTLAAGALTAVTCRATHRRQGLLTKMITADLTASVERGEPVGILIAAEYPIYGRFGYGPAVLSTRWELDTKAASFTTPGAGTVEYVDNETFRKEAPAIFERVRTARPGMIRRTDFNWDVSADLRRRPENQPWTGFRLLCRDEDGRAQGWANYKFNESWEGLRTRCTVDVNDLCAATPAAEARLWRFLAELDLIVSLSAGDRPVDEILPWLLADARAARLTACSDFLWVRPLDVVRTLEARTYSATGGVVLEVTDSLDLAGGRFALDASPAGATCSCTKERADLTVPVRTLGAACLGGMRLATLHAAGWLDEHTVGAANRADALFASAVTPWCNTWF
jgi:predicted acetyltransferase